MADFFRSLHETTNEYRDWASSDHPRIRTGLPFIDSRTEGGVASGELGILIARSGVGKTALGLHLARVNPHVSTLIFSKEMHARYMVRRLAAAHCNVPTSEVLATSPALVKIEQDFPHLGIIPYRLNLREMGRALDEAHAVWGRPVELVIIDYLELIKGGPSMSAAEGVAKMARDIKDATKQWDTATWVLHQVSRGAGDAGHVPLGINDGKFGAEEAADFLVGAYRPSLEPGLSQSEYLRCVPELYIQLLKTRTDGGIHPSGVRHYMDPRSMRISTWEEGTMTPLIPERVAREISDDDAHWFDETEGVLT